MYIEDIEKIETDEPWVSKIFGDPDTNWVRLDICTKHDNDDELDEATIYISGKHQLYENELMFMKPFNSYTDALEFAKKKIYPNIVNIKMLKKLGFKEENVSN